MDKAVSGAILEPNNVLLVLFVLFVFLSASYVRLERKMHKAKNQLPKVSTDCSFHALIPCLLRNNVAERQVSVGVVVFCDIQLWTDFRDKYVASIIHQLNKEQLFGWLIFKSLYTRNEFTAFLENNDYLTIDNKLLVTLKLPAHAFKLCSSPKHHEVSQVLVSSTY